MAWPLGMQRRYISSTSSGTQKVSSGGRPRISLVRRISSVPKGSPCALLVSVRCGEGQPMWLRSTMSDGLSSTAMARRSARSSATVSLATSPTVSTSQP